MTANEIKAKALIIGRELARKAWWNMDAKQADKFCQDKAESMGMTDSKEKQAVAILAMAYVLENGGNALIVCVGELHNDVLCQYCHKPILADDFHKSDENNQPCHKYCCPVCSEFGGEI